MAAKRVLRAAGKARGALKTVSMTGFGKGSAVYRGIKIDVEGKTVNNRYTDLALRLPREYQTLEPRIRDLIGRHIQRGRVELTVSRRQGVVGAAAAAFNPRMFRELSDTFYRIARREGVLDKDFKRRAILELLSRRDVVEATPGPPDLTSGEGRAVLQAVQNALKQVESSRRREGQGLGRDVAQRLRKLRTIHNSISKMSDSAPRRLRERLQERLRELCTGLEVDPQRLAQEVAILADKSDVSEELVRLELHIEEADASLVSAGTGRRLDFLLQEFTRELNTIASKTSDAAVSRLVVDAKAEVEKVREQVQNLE